MQCLFQINWYSSSSVLEILFGQQLILLMPSWTPSSTLCCASSPRPIFYTQSYTFLGPPLCAVAVYFFATRKSCNRYNTSSFSWSISCVNDNDSNIRFLVEVLAPPACHKVDSITTVSPASNGNHVVSLSCTPFCGVGGNHCPSGKQHGACVLG
jgi:hypothetical protein